MIVEAYTDAIAAHQTGVIITVALGGTALTAHHLSRLRRTTRNITLALDGDSAGQAVAERIRELADTTWLDLDVKVASLPAGRDPADLVTAGDTETLHQALTDAVLLSIHLINRTLYQHNLNEIEDKVRALRASGTIVFTISDPDVRAAAVDLVALRLGWDPSTVDVTLDCQLGKAPSTRIAREVPRRSLGLSK